jgi:uncharacterized membrane protein
MRPFTALARGRWPAAALVASLVLNGFLAGIIVADWLGEDRRRGGPRVGGFELRRLAERLPSDAVEQIAAKLEAQRPNVEARFERMRAIREEINAAAAAPSPDRAKIDERLAALRAEFSALQEEMQRATYDALLELPPDVRADLAEPPARS